MSLVILLLLLTFISCSDGRKLVCEGETYLITIEGDVRTAVEKRTGVSASFDKRTLKLTVFDASGNTVYQSVPFANVIRSFDEMNENSSLNGIFRYNTGKYYSGEEDKMIDCWRLYNGEVCKSTLQTDENAEFINSFVQNVHELLTTEKQICGMAQALEPTLFITDEMFDVFKKRAEMIPEFALSDISMECTITVTEAIVSALETSMWNVAAFAVFDSSANTVIDKLPYLGECWQDCISTFNEIPVVSLWNDQ